MPKVEISVKTAGGQTIVLSEGDRLVKEVTIECNSGRCASRRGQDKPAEVVVVDEALPEAGDQWLSLILPERSPLFAPMPKNFCSPQCVRDFLIYDYIAPGPRTVSVQKPDNISYDEPTFAKVYSGQAEAQADGYIGDPGDEHQ
jgi:hypothetical protein